MKPNHSFIPFFATSYCQAFVSFFRADDNRLLLGSRMHVCQVRLGLNFCVRSAHVHKFVHTYRTSHHMLEQTAASSRPPRRFHPADIDRRPTWMPSPSEVECTLQVHLRHRKEGCLTQKDVAQITLGCECLSRHWLVRRFLSLYPVCQLLA